jgi:hypothetical protein
VLLKHITILYCIGVSAGVTPRTGLLWPYRGSKILLEAFLVRALSLAGNPWLLVFIPVNPAFTRFATWPSSKELVFHINQCLVLRSSAQSAMPP